MVPTFPVLGIEVAAVEPAEAVDVVIAAARDRRPLGVSALAVHGVMEGRADAAHQYRLNDLELVVADGQPVRWALRWLHGVRLRRRVYGPTLMDDVCRAAADEGLPVFLFGSAADTLERLQANLVARYPALVIAGSQPSRFRHASEEERAADIETIRASGAAITFAGLGAPRQEIWAWEMREDLSMPVLAVGAAFDFHAGTVSQAPKWMGDRGLEWLYRLVQEPKRLWRRYLILNPLYLWNVLLQRLGRDPVPLARAVPPTGRVRPS